jgi:uncharacterized membrane protein
MSTATAPQSIRLPLPLSRIASVDLARGIAMILMAIDHVRVYSGVPAGGPTPGIFFTRWITNFVAPAFVFLAGTAAYLHGRKLVSRSALSRFLLVRGIWLIFLELTVIRVAWTFNFDFAHYMLAGVIWMLGWCMIIMAAAVYLPVRAVGIIGLLIIALHNITDLFRGQLAHAFGEAGPNALLKLLYFGGAVNLGPSGPPLLILYVIVPWIGVMMAGYAFGSLLEKAPEQRRSLCLRLGLIATTLFVLLRALDLYGDPRRWHAMKLPAVLAFLNTTKYPASLSFLLMTLGPMFYYLLHIPLIHLAACVVSLIREGHVNPWLFGNLPVDPLPIPPGYTWNLGLLYLVWALCVATLYFPCRWYARLRAARKSDWLSYL